MMKFLHKRTYKFVTFIEQESTQLVTECKCSCRVLILRLAFLQLRVYEIDTSAIITFQNSACVIFFSTNTRYFKMR